MKEEIGMSNELGMDVKWYCIRCESMMANFLINWLVTFMISSENGFAMYNDVEERVKELWEFIKEQTLFGLAYTYGDLMGRCQMQSQCGEVVTLETFRLNIL